MNLLEIILVGIGGATGSFARFHLGKYINEKHSKNRLIGTFIINVTGAFLLGIVVFGIKSEAYTVLLADGFLGAYTTFSTFMYEGYSLTQEGKTLGALKYLVGSVMTGLAGFAVGVFLIS